MHNAPPVSYPVGRFSGWLGVHAALWIAGAAVLAGWVSTSTAAQQMAPALVVLMLALAWVNWRAWVHPPVGMLAWRDGLWTWQASQIGSLPLAGLLVRQWDGQDWMLVRLQSHAGQSVWLCLARKTGPERWHDLRRAVYSRAMTGNPRLQ